MLKLFKKQTVKRIFQSTEKTVQQIHAEFNTAGDRLLAEANEIINSKEALFKKAGRLQKVGFAILPEMRQAVRIERIENNIELVKEYQFHYPRNKFIIEEQVRTICEKYNLFCGYLNQYKGFVPEKSLNQIENFKLKEEHFQIKYDYIKVSKEEYNELLLKAEAGDPNIQTYLNHSNEAMYRIDQRPSKESFKICAPEKDMEMYGGKKTSYNTISYPDPVVLQPVKGGYLIVTAWGDEASDEIVLNPKEN